MANAFHETGPLRRGPFVYVDCRRDEPRLRSALQACFTRAAGNGKHNLVLAAWGGTLYLDHVTRLRPATQKLVMWALDRAGGDGADNWPLRVGAGDDEDPTIAVKEGRFLRGLHDALDKIHIDLGRPVADLHASSTRKPLGTADCRCHPARSIPTSVALV